MPTWIHERAEHLRSKNPSMPKSQAFAIATQQAYAAGKAPKNYGTAEGKREAKKKYEEPKSHYEGTANPSHKVKTSENLSLWKGSSADPGSKNASTPTRVTEENEMHDQLTGYTPLHTLMQRAIAGGVEKRAAAEGKQPAKKDIVEKQDETPATEKVASGLDPMNAEHMEKLASALEEAGEKLAADGVYNGGEAKGGGEQLANAKPVAGKQSYKKDGNPAKDPKKDEGKMSPKPSDGAGAGTLNADNMPMGVKPAYPAKGVFKTAGAELLAKLKAKTGKDEKKEEKEEKEEKKEEDKEKKSSALATVLGELDKEAEFHGGGETLDSAAQQGPKPPSNPGRQLIASNSAPAAATKREAKSPRKAELKQVLTEPAMSKAHDSKVQDNLQNASKGGVKIAGVAKALLQKIAAEGCTCSGKGECRYCSMQAKIEERKKS